MARSSSWRATSILSCQSIDAGVTCGMGPTIISAAAMNSLARCPCVTITPPTRRTGSVLAGCESITFISFPRIQALPSSFLSGRRALAHVTMYGLGVKAGALQSSGNLIRYHYRTVTSAGAANSHGQIRFAFALILRQKVIKQIAESFQRLFNFRLRFQVLHDSAIT